MKDLKDILLHTTPVVVLALAAIFGLGMNEKSMLTQLLTAIVGGVFAVIPIIKHCHDKKTAAKSKSADK